MEGGSRERLAARRALKDLVLIMRRIGLAAEAGQFDEAARDYQSYRGTGFATCPSCSGLLHRGPCSIRSCIKRTLRNCSSYFRRPTDSALTFLMGMTTLPFHDPRGSAAMALGPAGVHFISRSQRRHERSTRLSYSSN